tara:strand:+ start:2645 stop:2863 length:219 start_codon:yes stop_codon:yes gene_type:complete
MDEIDEIYNNAICKIDEKCPNVSQLWVNYLEKHTKLYKNVLNDFNNFIDKNKTEMSKENILMLYLILNNDIK